MKKTVSLHKCQNYDKHFAKIVCMKYGHIFCMSRLIFQFRLRCNHKQDNDKLSIGAKQLTRKDKYTL